MAEYNENEYFPIIAAVIRANQVVPFDCFLLLRTNQRVVHLAKAGEEFPDSKLSKLNKFRFDQLHIRNEDKPAYFKYLKDFIQTEEGKDAIRKIQASFEGAQAFDGLPENLQLTLGEIKELDGPESEAETKIIMDEPEKEPETIIEDLPKEEEQEQAFSKDSETEEDTTVNEAKEDEDENITVEGVTDKIDEENLNVEGTGDEISDDAERVEGESEKIQEEIVSVLHDSAEEIDAILNVKNKASKEEIQIIKDVTDRIKKEIEKVKGSEENDESNELIQAATKKIRDELSRVSGIIDDNDDNRFQVIKPKIQKMRNEIEIIVAGSDSEDSREKWRKIKNLSTQIGINNEEIQEILETDEKTLVEEKVSKIVSGLEKVLNKKIDLESSEISDTLFKLIEKIYKASLVFNKTLESKIKLDPQIKKNFFVISTRINKLYKIVTEEKTIVSEANNIASSLDDISNSKTELNPEDEIDSTIAKDLKDLVGRQNKTIVGLKSRLTHALAHFAEINEAWHKFQNETKETMPAGDKLKAQQFAVNLNEFESHYLGMKNQTDSLVSISEDLSKFADVDNVSKLLEIEANEKGSNTAVSNKKSSTSSDSLDSLDSTFDSTASTVSGIETLEIPPPIPDDADIDEFRAENKILRLQLENAKSLIDAGNSKLAQLTKLVNDSSDYTESLEKETNERKLETQKQIDKLDKVEIENQKMREGSNDVDRIIKRAKIDLVNREESLQNTQDQLDANKKELQTWKARVMKLEAAMPKQNDHPDKVRVPEEILREIKEKDKYAQKLHDKLNTKISQYKEIYKENFKLKNQLAGINQLKKNMSERHDKIQSEKENFRQSQDAMSRKVFIIQGLLEKARKTVSKITESNDTLRQERIEYMNKTNQAMKGYKDMISKANSLTNHVQAEIQRNQSLGDQFETMKRKYQESAAKTNELQRQIKLFESEKKQMKKLVTDAQNMVNSAGIQKQVKQLQNAVKSLEKENKSLSKQFSEQRAIAKTYQQQVMMLQNQIKKSSAA